MAFSLCVQRKNKTNHVSGIVSAPSTKDSAFTVENTEHGLEVCNSPVRRWAYDPTNIFGLMKSDVSCYH